MGKVQLKLIDLADNGICIRDHCGRTGVGSYKDRWRF
jgi:hypothetical protein